MFLMNAAQKATKMLAIDAHELNNIVDPVQENSVPEHELRNSAQSCSC